MEEDAIEEETDAGAGMAEGEEDKSPSRTPTQEGQEGQEEEQEEQALQIRIQEQINKEEEEEEAQEDDKQQQEHF